MKTNSVEGDGKQSTVDNDIDNAISTMKKIRWYHWLVYRLFYHFWNPILASNHQLRRHFINHLIENETQNYHDLDGSNS